MDKDSFAKEPSKTVGSRDIVVTTAFLSVDYCEPPTSVEDVRTSDTGHLELLRIEPKWTGLPSFSVRWDHKDDSIDVDLLTSSQEEVRLFKAEKAGYRGHHTCRLDQSSRTQVIDIQTPSTGPVFKGTITLNIDLAMLVNFRVIAGVECRAELIRGGKVVDTDS